MPLTHRKDQDHNQFFASLTHKFVGVYAIYPNSLCEILAAGSIVLCLLSDV